MRFGVGVNIRKVGCRCRRGGFRRLVGLSGAFTPLCGVDINCECFNAASSFERLTLLLATAPLEFSCKHKESWILDANSEF